MEDTPVPVVPMALRGLWGSFFSRSYEGKAMRRWRGVFSRIALVVGAAGAAGARDARGAARARCWRCAAMRARVRSRDDAARIRLRRRIAAGRVLNSTQNFHRGIR